MVHTFQEQIVIPVSRIRCVASQVISCMPPNFLLLDLGMAISFATIAVPSLLNANEGLSLDETQASWFGSLSYLTQPVGALLSGPIVDYFGRKRANFLVNIPHLVAWILMYFAWNLPSLFIANALLGLGTGVMEAPINSYVGEISEPSVRGALCTVTQLFTSIGVFVMYFLGTVVDWRNAALISLIVPISSMAFVFLVPETPVWLLFRGREKEALKSLCYLRGWTTPENVRKEFDSLVKYSKKLQKCPICYKLDDEDTQNDCEHFKMNAFKRSIYKCRYIMLGKETIRPLMLVMMYFLFFVMSGLTPIRPNMVNICGALGMSQDGKDAVLMVGVITFLTSIIVTAMIKIVGKRKLAISAMFGTAIFCASLSIYAKKNLDDSVYSYDTETFPEEKSHVPLVLFYLMAMCTGLGIPWVLLGEVFPFRSIYKCRYIMLGKETIRPLMLVMMYFLFFVMSGLTPIRPNMVNICGALGMSQDGKDAVLMVGVITFLTSIIVIAMIKIVGKRKLAISAMFGTAIFCASLSIYAKKNLDDSVYSYDTETFPEEKSHVPLVLFYLMAMCTGLGIPWVLLGEVFPFRSRASAQGVAAASNYIFSFLGSKTFIDLEINLKLWGAFATYSGFGFLGTVYLYFYLPETEGKTLQEIEDFYNADKLRIFADDPVINLFKRFKRKKYYI